LPNSESRQRKLRMIRSLVLYFVLFCSVSPLYTNCGPGYKTSDNFTDLSSAVNPNQTGGDSYTPVASPTPSPEPTSTPTATPAPTTPPPSSVTLVSCSSSQFEFPLATHWSSAVSGFQEGASDLPNLGNPNPIANRQIYNYGLLPKFNQYIADRYELNKFEDIEFRNWSMNVCASTGVAVEARRPLSFSNWSVARQKVVESRGSIQTLHALIIDNNLVTIYLPPNWKRSDARGKYPILVNGFYDLKAGVIHEGAAITKAMGLAWKNSGTPFIGISWNGGGAIGSRTVNPQARASFNKILQQVGDLFGGDPQRVVIFGGSRGGMTALSMASNLEKYPYRIIAAYAAVPAVDFPSAGRLTGSSMPYLLHAAEWSIGLLDTWKKTFRYPSNGSGMDGFTRDGAHLYILAGSRNPADFESRLNLSSPAMLSALKETGAQVFLELGSHDIICPWVDQFQMIQKMEAAGIPFEARINYLLGHSTSGLISNGENFARIMAKIDRSDYNGIFQIGTRSYHRYDYQLGRSVAVAPGRFTFELPRYQSPSVDGHIIMTGIPGTQVEFGGKFNGTDYATQSAVLNAQGVSVSNMAPLALGNYTVTFIRIKKPGSTAWKNIDLRHSTTGWNRGALVLDVLEADLDGNTSAAHIGELIQKGYLGADLKQANGDYSSVSYGVVEVD
jgi:predicted esterase